MLDTISVYSNDPISAGYVLFGIERQGSEPSEYKYSRVGVKDPDNLQQEIATQCNNETFSCGIRPEIAVDTAPNGARVVVVKPVFITSKGVSHGCLPPHRIDRPSV